MMSLKIPQLKLHILLLSVILLNATAMTSCQNSSLNSYIPYEAISKSEVFRIEVNGQQVFVGKEECFGDSIFHTSQFFVEGETEITIECIDPIADFAIRPYHKKIKGEVNGKVLKFRVTKPEMLLVTINEFKPLALFQTPPETDIPDPNDPNVIYYKKGIHEVGLLSPKSGQTIYLEQGAWVKGRLYGEGVENVNIKGRGIIDARGYTDKPKKLCGLEFKNSKNILVDGIGLRTGPWWQSLYILCENVEVKNMNLMSFGVNNDGIDIDGVTNFKASSCWIGCGDDGFGWHAVDAEANGQPPTKNCVAENCVIFNSHAGNGLRVGASMETELFEDITFKDITVFAHANAGIRSDHSDWAMCRNIRFENFYLEQPGRPIDVRIEKTRYSNATGYRDERGKIYGLFFNNVIASGGDIILEGFDEEHLIKEVKFINCYNGEKKIAKMDDIEVNEFVRDITFE
jgi:hypothetical protein